MPNWKTFTQIFTGFRQSATDWPYPKGYWFGPGKDPYERWPNCVVSFGFMVDACGCRRKMLQTYLRRRQRTRYGMYYPVVVDDAVQAEHKGESRVGYSEPMTNPHGIIFKVYANGPVAKVQAKLNHEVAGAISRPCPHQRKPSGWWKLFGHQFTRK